VCIKRGIIHLRHLLDVPAEQVSVEFAGRLSVDGRKFDMNDRVVGHLKTSLAM
jgi:hypothetical protein